MKVSLEPFQRLAQVEGVKPSSRPQARNVSYAVFGSFCSSLLKKNGENYLNVMISRGEV